MSGRNAAQLNEIEVILNDLKLLDNRVFHPRYPVRPAHEFKGMKYAELWELCYTEQYCDFVLVDFSLLQFRKMDESGGELSYSYLECPRTNLSYQTFVEAYGFTFEDAGDIFRVEYETELSSLPPKQVVTPIRYDYDPKSYVEGSHPASHVHIGHDNDIRIATTRILKPLSFALFVIRQRYCKSWNHLCKSKKAATWCRNVRQSLSLVDQKYKGSLDDWEMFLS